MDYPTIVLDGQYITIYCCNGDREDALVIRHALPSLSTNLVVGFRRPSGSAAPV